MDNCQANEQASQPLQSHVAWAVERAQPRDKDAVVSWLREEQTLPYHTAHSSATLAWLTTVKLSPETGQGTSGQEGKSPLCKQVAVSSRFRRFTEFRRFTGWVSCPSPNRGKSFSRVSRVTEVTLLCCSCVESKTVLVTHLYRVSSAKHEMTRIQSELSHPFGIWKDLVSSSRPSQGH